MRPRFKRIVAALMGAVSLATPGTVWAGEYCPTYAQVASSSTGGSYVGGILMYETTATYETKDPTISTTTTVETTGSVGVPGTSAGGTTVISTTVIEEGETKTIQQPVGYYQMNDGSIYEINCITGAYTQVKAPTS
jgi:hypothetical protein